MINNGIFKSFEELTEEEKQLAYKMARFAITDATKNNLLTPSVLSKSVIEISQLSKIEAHELSDIVLEMHSLAHQLSFGRKKREGIGFKNQK